MELLLIRKNLLRNRKRTALTVVGVAISIFLFCGLLTVITVMNNLLNDAENSSVLGVRNFYSWVEGTIPVSYVERVRQVPGVQTVCPLNFLTSYVDTGKPNLFGLAADPVTVREIFPEFKEIPEESYQSFMRERTGALIGKEKMEVFGWKVGDVVTLRGASVPVDIPIKITGVIPYGGLADNFVMHRDYFAELNPDKGNINFILLKVGAGHSPAQMIQTIDQTFQRDAIKIKTETVKSVLLALIGQIDNLQILIIIIAAIILVSSLLLAANSIAMSVRGRRRELAVLQTIGYTPRRILLLVLGESLVIFLIGGIIGSVTAYVVFYYIGLNVPLGPQTYFNMPWETLLEALLICAVVGVLSGLIPALGSVRMVLANALRRVG